jgi:multisubunit Na+/H+ antiporter MnhG subunit
VLFEGSQRGQELVQFDFVADELLLALAALLAAPVRYILLGEAVNDGSQSKLALFVTFF